VTENEKVQPHDKKQAGVGCRRDSEK
jgi:hypothetical protein